MSIPLDVILISTKRRLRKIDYNSILSDHGDNQISQRIIKENLHSQFKCTFVATVLGYRHMSIRNMRILGTY